jgi:hypothetical protein
VLVGRAVTAMFVPQRPDLDDAFEQYGRATGHAGGQNTWVIDSLVEGDVIVVDLFGKIPIRIGNTTILPGDVVLGTREGVTFIPPTWSRKSSSAPNESACETSSASNGWPQGHTPPARSTSQPGPKRSRRIFPGGSRLGDDCLHATPFAPDVGHAFPVDGVVVDVFQAEVDGVADVGRAIAGDAVTQLVVAEHGIAWPAGELDRLG